MPESFRIHGRVLAANGAPLAGALVSVFDRDLPSRQALSSEPLGDARAGRDGVFELAYEATQFSRAEKANADLAFVIGIDRQELRILRVAANGVDLEGGAIIFNAPADLRVEITVDAERGPRESEYETLRAAIDPVLDGLPPERLTPDDVAFLLAESEVDRRRLEILIEASRLGGLWAAPVEALYGLARMDLPLDGARLRELGPARLTEALHGAVERAIISRAFQDRIPGAVRAILLAGQAPGRLTLRLVDAATGEPLAGARVEVAAEQGEPRPGADEGDLTNAAGEIDLARPIVEPRLALRISPDGAPAPTLVNIEVPAQDERLEVRVTSVHEALEAIDADLPAPVRSALADRGIASLTTLRRAGGLGAFAELAATLDPQAVRRIDAHADLSRLMDDPAQRQQLMDRGFDSVSDVAALSRSSFLARLDGVVSDVHAVRLHLAASAQARLLDAAAAGELARGGGTLRSAEGAADDLAPEAACACDDCTSAVGPLAYVADLLHYAVAHLRNAGQPVSIAELEQAFAQPFAELRVSCAAVDEPVRQVLLVVESLRQLLAAAPPAGDAAARLQAAEHAYRLAAYQRLLMQLGASYEDVRVARTSPEERAALATRLGVRLTQPAPAGGDEVARLFLDPAAGPGTPTELSEASLEALFGLADTTRDRLSGGAKLADTDAQIRRWSFTGADPGRTVSGDGSVFLTLAGTADGGVDVAAYADPALTLKVAAGLGAAPNATVVLTPVSGTGLSGVVELAFTTGTPGNASIEIVAVPRLLCWRLAAVRAGWAAEDASGSRFPGPVIDPDLIALARLNDPVSGPAAELWARRSAAIASRETALRALLQADPALAVDDVLDAVLTDALGVGGAAIADLHARLQQGQDVAAELAAHRLTSAGLARLASVWRVADGGGPVVPAEWDDVIHILVQAWKAGQLAAWRSEEQAPATLVTLSPNFFQPVEGAPPLPPGPSWRADALLALAWQDLLRSRAAQVVTVATSFRDAVSATETATLPALRDALLRALSPAAPDLATAADLAARQLFVDAKAGGCQHTTRVAHAIEALQAAITAAHDDQFRAAPTLTLAAPAFDQEWRWIGSYGAWRAAMFVYIRPDALLLPSLFEPKSSAFETLLEASTARPLTRGRAQEIATAHALYFEDVCTLKVEATCTATARLTSQPGYGRSDDGFRCLLFLFGRGGKTGTLYVSTADPESSSTYPQRHWRAVDMGPGVVSSIIGATPYQTPSGRRFIYVFVKRLEGVLERLAWARMDVERGTWEPVQTLALPAGATQFSAVLVARSQAILGGIPRSWNYSVAPQLLIRVRDLAGSFTGAWHERQFSSEGDGWESDDFSKIDFGAKAEIPCVVDEGNNSLFIVVRDGPDLTCVLATANSAAPRQLVKGYRYPTFAGLEVLRDQAYRGALVFPYVPTIGFLLNSLYLVTAPASGGVAAVQIRRAPGGGLELSAAPLAVPSDFVVLPSSGTVDRDKQGLQAWFAYVRTADPARAWYARLLRTGGGSGQLTASVPAKPVVAGPFQSSAPLPAPSLQLRRAMIAAAYAGAQTSTQLLLLHEAFYVVPMAIALELARGGERTAALEWFRLCYDFTAAPPARKIAHLLKQEESLANLVPRAADWLLDPLNPHRLAATRRNAYTRFTLASIAQCMLDEADADFTADTPESLPRARRRYEAVLALLEAPELAPAENGCDRVVGMLAEGPADQPAIQLAMKQLSAAAGAIGDPVALTKAVTGANLALLGATPDQPWGDRIAAARGLFAEAATAPGRRLGELLAVRERRVAAARTRIAQDPDVDRAVSALAPIVMREADRAMAVVTGASPTVLEARRQPLPWLHDPSLRLTEPARLRKDVAALATPGMTAAAAAAAEMPASAFDLMTPFSGAYAPLLPVGFCIPPDPAIESLRSQARLNLHKLRSCRNIAGMVRAMDAYAAPTDAVSGRPTAVGGVISAPGVSTRSSLPPTQYRYEPLVERARQLAQQAAQMEALMLQALQGAKSDNLSQFKAQQDIGQTVANMRLQSTRLAAAQKSVALATAQQARSRLQASTYQTWITAPLNAWEKLLLQNYADLQAAQDQLATLDAAAQIAQVMATAAAGGATGAAAAMPFAAAAALALTARTSAVEDTNQVQAAIQVNGLYATLENRRRDWELQRLLAEQDILIGAESIAQAEAQVAVVTTEQEIASMNAAFARDAFEFLSHQFLNAARYEWMSRQYERAYRYFLQEGTVMARLAHQELAFARQALPPVEIQDDYWDPPAGRGAPGEGDGRGLTGSARLLEDIQRLEQYAFTTRRRAASITKTVSLARLYPLEFQRFRETGVMGFATPMELFDRDFPGHYLRLIHKVRIAVVALVPPAEGVRATLTTSGISRVVIGPHPFQTVVVRRDPDTQIISAAGQAAGLVEAEAQTGDLLAPFEGHGVDTSWMLSMPKAANAIDYGAMADVLLTLEFSALPSDAYRREVIQAMRPTLEAERAFSLANDFGDAWYDLNNPELLEPTQRMHVKFRIRRQDFPSHLQGLHIDHVVLYAVRADGFTAELTIPGFSFTPAGTATALGGTATTVEGIVSTRRANGAAWASLVGREPVGEWELVLPDTPLVKGWFREGRITDLLLVIGYSGRLPAWPE